MKKAWSQRVFLIMVGVLTASTFLAACQNSANQNILALTITPSPELPKTATPKATKTAIVEKTSTPEPTSTKEVSYSLKTTEITEVKDLNDESMRLSYQKNLNSPLKIMPFGLLDETILGQGTLGNGMHGYTENGMGAYTLSGILMGAEIRGNKMIIKLGLPDTNSKLHVLILEDESIAYPFDPAKGMRDFSKPVEFSLGEVQDLDSFGLASFTGVNQDHWGQLPPDKWIKAAENALGQQVTIDVYVAPTEKQLNQFYKDAAQYYKDLTPVATKFTNLQESSSEVMEIIQLLKGKQLGKLDGKTLKAYFGPVRMPVFSLDF